jgi:hypothetical protein
MNDVRAKAKAFYNTLDFRRPIDFGLTQLVEAERAQPESLYLPSLHHGDGTLDTVQELADQLDFSQSAGAYLFTGNGGTGKTTELMRLARILEGGGFEVFYVDLSEYLNLTQRIEITDFLIGMMGALSEKAKQRFNEDVGTAGFFERVCSFLETKVRFEEVTLPAGPAELHAALVQAPHFKEELQRRTRGHVPTLVEQAREFALEVVELARRKRSVPDLKVVLIVDSMDRLRGVGGPREVRDVLKSVETLFNSHADLLRFTGLSVVYTIPPYLQALAGGLGRHYAGGRIHALPSVDVYECCPEAGESPKVSASGIDKLLAVIDRRFPDHGEFFSHQQLRRLAQSSGGDLRDFFRMARLAITWSASQGLPLPENVIEHAEDAVRRDMLPLAADDREWLVRIAHSHAAELPSLDRLPELARLQEGKYVLQYRNGEDWYAVHPLLREELGLG